MLKSKDICSHDSHNLSYLEHYRTLYLTNSKYINCDNYHSTHGLVYCVGNLGQATPPKPIHVRLIEFDLSFILKPLTMKTLLLGIL